MSWKYPLVLPILFLKLLDLHWAFRLTHFPLEHATGWLLTSKFVAKPEQIIIMSDCSSRWTASFQVLKHPNEHVGCSRLLSSSFQSNAKAHCAWEFFRDDLQTAHSHHSMLCFRMYWQAGTISRIKSDLEKCDFLRSFFNLISSGVEYIRPYTEKLNVVS
jgi:hypothetical protein